MSAVSLINYEELLPTETWNRIFRDRNLRDPDYLHARAVCQKWFDLIRNSDPFSLTLYCSLESNGKFCLSLCRPESSKRIFPPELQQSTLIDWIDFLDIYLPETPKVSFGINRMNYV
jgi:hypothetical protein